MVAAFDHLIAEGYIQGSVGSGSFVRDMTALSSRGPRPGARACAAMSLAPSLSLRGRRLVSHPFPLRMGATAHTFRLDTAALDAFPIKTWSRITAALSAHRGPASPRARPYSRISAFAGGNRTVRRIDERRAMHGRAGRDHLRHPVRRSTSSRGSCSIPGIASGWRILATPPCPSLLRGAGAEVVGIPVDDFGLDCERGRRRARLAKLACVTPGCHFPLGVTMSLQRRLALLEWAREAGAWIFEDDYDSQLGFSGRPLAALQSLDRNGCVIYSNSFSKMLFPSLRLGFLIVPQTLLGAVEAARSVLQRFPSVLDQAVLAEFIAAGHMEQHMRRMRDLYTQRHDALVRIAQGELADVLRLSPMPAGLQTVGWLAEGIPEIEASRQSAEQGIMALPLSSLTVERSMPPGLVLGAAATDIPAIRRGVEQLGDILRRLQRGNTAATA